MNSGNINLTKLFFIASYMKSGNTWVRSIICSLLNKGNFKLKDLNKIQLFSQKDSFLNLPNIKYALNGNIDFEFICNNWLNAQKIISIESKQKIIFYKTHNVRGVINGNYFTDESVCSGFIYLIRDPRDIVISYAKHMNITIDKSIEILLYKNNYVTEVLNVNEAVCTWENHINSWINFKVVPRLIMKYEDMIQNNKKCVKQIADFLKIILKDTKLINSQDIKNTIESTSFDKLKKLESNEGFVEATSQKFFRSGKSEQWKNVLNSQQRELIEVNLKEPMKDLGYL